MLNFDIENKAYLVALKIRKWSPSKRIETSILESHYSAKAGSVSASKHLLGGKENNSYADKLEAIRIVADEARKFVYEQTLPWSNKGERILLTRNKSKFDTELRRLEGDFQAAVKDWVEVYPRAIKESAVHLGSLYNADDFPSDISQCYDFALEPSAIPTGADFRLDIAEESMQEMRDALDERNRELVGEAMRDAFGKLHKEIKAIADFFDRENAGKKVRFHDSLVDNLKNLVKVLPDINLTDDQALLKLAKDAEKELSGLTSGKVKKMTPKEKETARAKAHKVAEQCAGFMGQTA